MTTVRLKGAWEVRAGVIPRTCMDEHHKRWCYTEEEFEADMKIGENEVSRFRQLRDEAWTYAEKLMHPAYLNWVELTWIWF